MENHSTVSTDYHSVPHMDSLWEMSHDLSDNLTILQMIEDSCIDSINKIENLTCSENTSELDYLVSSCYSDITAVMKNASNQREMLETLVARIDKGTQEQKYLSSMLETSAEMNLLCDRINQRIAQVRLAQVQDQEC